MGGMITKLSSIFVWHEEKEVENQIGPFVGAYTTTVER